MKNNTEAVVDARELRKFGYVMAGFLPWFLAFLCLGGGL